MDWKEDFLPYIVIRHSLQLCSGRCTKSSIERGKEKQRFIIWYRHFTENNQARLGTRDVHNIKMYVSFMCHC